MPSCQGTPPNPPRLAPDSSARIAAQRTGIRRARERVSHDLTPFFHPDNFTNPVLAASQPTRSFLEGNQPTHALREGSPPARLLP